MRAKEFIAEIGYAAHMVDVNFDTNNAKLATSKDGLEIWTKTIDGFVAWFTKNNDEPSAYIITSEYALNGKFHRLYRLKNRTAPKGTVSMLVSVVVDQFYPLYIASDEELTNDGFVWLTGAIKNGLRGRKITDQNNNKPDIQLLNKEWTTSFETGESGPTEIFIEGKFIKKRIEHPLLGILTEFVNDSREVI